MRTIVVFGASSAIAEACMRRWCEAPTRFVLVGRRPQLLAAIAADLHARNPDGACEIVHGQFGSAEEVARTVSDSLEHWAPDIAVVAFGSLPDQDELAGDPAALVDALNVNGVWPALCAQLLFERMRERDHGTLVLIGSVAGDRGRRANYVYGSAKALLATFSAGLQHAAARSRVQVCLVKPGPTDTPMTRAAGTRGRLASPDAVAATIVAGIAAGKPVIYAPPRWRLIMAVIRWLPRSVFNRLNV
jgi:decaprenylphospho-beta-D-erythro-pentofuranosid-2-ulose 2-reductase